MGYGRDHKANAKLPDSTLIICIKKQNLAVILPGTYFQQLIRQSSSAQSRIYNRKKICDSSYRVNKKRRMVHKLRLMHLIEYFRFPSILP